MSYSDKATQLHESGWNCCQAVLCSCCDNLSLNVDTAYRIGAFFGAGMRQGEACGAVTGTLMALGLRYGDENNRNSRKSIEFINAFKDRYGSVRCSELIGEDGKKKKELCPELICFCADYLEKELSE